MKDLAWLKTKQDVTQKNFGMVGMGYVVEVWNEQQAIIKKLESEKAALYEAKNSILGELHEVHEKLQIAVEALKFYPDNNKIRATQDKHMNDVAIKTLARIEQGEKPDGILKKE